MGRPRLRKERPVPDMSALKGATRAALHRASIPKFSSRQPIIHLRLAVLTLPLNSFFSSRDISFLCSAR